MVRFKLKVQSRAKSIQQRLCWILRRGIGEQAVIALPSSKKTCRKFRYPTLDARNAKTLLAGEKLTASLSMTATEESRPQIAANWRVLMLFPATAPGLTRRFHSTGSLDTFFDVCCPRPDKSSRPAEFSYLMMDQRSHLTSGEYRNEESERRSLRRTDRRDRRTSPRTRIRRPDGTWCHLGFVWSHHCRLLCRAVRRNAFASQRSNRTDDARHGIDHPLCQ